LTKKALIIALKEKWIAGAGLDVMRMKIMFLQNFLSLQNTVLTPHTASATVELE